MEEKLFKKLEEARENIASVEKKCLKNKRINVKVVQELHYLNVRLIHLIHFLKYSKEDDKLKLDKQEPFKTLSNA